MPGHKVYLICVCLLLLLLLMLHVDAARIKRSGKRSTNKVQSRIVSGTTGTGTSRRRGNSSRGRSSKATARIVSGNSGKGNSRRNRGNRKSRRANRKSRRANRGARSRKANVAARIVDNSGSSSGSKVQARVVGGSSTSISKVPYLAQIHIDTTGLCGGSIYTTQWIITAAHCVYGKSLSAFRVVVGATNQNGPKGQVFSVIKALVPSKFTTKVMNMDVALLKLNATMTTGTNVATIALATKMPKVGTKLLVAGWGATKENGQTVKHLQSTKVPIVDRDECKEEYRKEAKITASMFCASGKNKDTCSGDSGGGAYYNDTLVGITSFGYGCARAKYPGVYTKIPYTRNWIVDSVAAN